MKVWAVEIDISDPYYGKQVEKLFATKKKAEEYIESDKRILELCGAEISEWEVIE